MTKLIDIPPVWLALAICLVWLQATFAPVGPVSGGFVRGVGGLCVALGVATIVAAALEFLRHKTTIIPHQTPARIIESGIFSLSRNPIYLGDTLVLAGFVLRFGAWPSLVLVPIFVWWIEKRFITPEEDRMRTAFEGDFVRYERNVRRWL